MHVGTLADISGDNAVHQISTSAILARWVKFSATGGAVRVGDSNVSSSRGANVPQNGSFEFPESRDPFDNYPLSQLSAYVPSGATLQITYGGSG